MSVFKTPKVVRKVAARIQIILLSGLVGMGIHSSFLIAAEPNPCLFNHLQQKDRDPSLRDAASQLPDILFESVFTTGGLTQRSEYLADLSFSGGFPLSSSDSVRSIYWSGGKMRSHMIALENDVFVEGFYRNARYSSQSTSAPIDQPWIRWDAHLGEYRYETQGAEKRIVEFFLKSPEAKAAARTDGKIALFHGGTKEAYSKLLEIQDLLKRPGGRPKALKKAKEFAAQSRHGIFATPDLERAKVYANPSLLEIQIEPNVLQTLADQDQLFAGFEFHYFEFSFQTPEAILKLAEALTRNP